MGEMYQFPREQDRSLFQRIGDLPAIWGIPIIIAIIMATSLIVGVACGDSADSAPKDPPAQNNFADDLPTTVRPVTDWGDLPGSYGSYFRFREIIFNGRHCIIYEGADGGGLSCDWSAK
ncbi:MAG TPA: hypothetical protein VJ742_12700 [Nitrososphaera sp.]|nr:hypothetical protein [Nitrososphaera sp.]